MQGEWGERRGVTRAAKLQLCPKTSRPAEWVCGRKTHPVEVGQHEKQAGGERQKQQRRDRA